MPRKNAQAEIIGDSDAPPEISLVAEKMVQYWQYMTLR